MKLSFHSWKHRLSGLPWGKTLVVVLESWVFFCSVQGFIFQFMIPPLLFEKTGATEKSEIRRPVQDKYLKWRTDIFDSCWRRPETTTGILDGWQSLEATSVGTFLTWSLTYDPTRAQSFVPSSISASFARTCFWVRVKLSNANILAYSGGNDSYSQTGWGEKNMSHEINKFSNKIALAVISDSFFRFKVIGNNKIIGTLGSQDDVLNDLSPLYLANRFFAGTSNGVSTSSGNSVTWDMNAILCQPLNQKVKKKH